MDILQRSIIACLLMTWLSGQAFGQSAQPIITFDQSHPLIQEDHGIPMVQVFSNGTVKVNRRAGKRNPGQYELKLSEPELTELIALAKSAGIADLNSMALEVSIDPSGTISRDWDPTTTILAIDPVQSGIGVASDAGDVGNINETIQLESILTLADENPDMPGIQAIKLIHLKMIDLFSQAGE